MRHIAITLTLITLMLAHWAARAESASAFPIKQTPWIEWVMAVPYTETDIPNPTQPMLQCVRQDHVTLHFNQSVIGTPLKIGQTSFAHGLGTHSVSLIRIYSPEPISRFQAWVGVDNNYNSSESDGAVTFAVSGVVSGKEEEFFHSGVLQVREEPQRVDFDAKGAQLLELHVGDGGNGPYFDHADWADAKIVTKSGKEIYLDQFTQGEISMTATAYPFSFTFGGKKSDDILKVWPHETTSIDLPDGRTQQTMTWTDPASALKVEWVATRFPDFPALDWMLYFENSGTQDTPIIEDVQALDLTISTPLTNGNAYQLHKTNGAPSNTTDFAYNQVAINSQHSEQMSGSGGRSSQKDFPFFKVDTGLGPMIFAIGWSGQWAANLTCANDANLRIKARLEKTHFLLHPGERVRMPRILMLHWEGETWESNAQFRQMITKYYAAKRSGKTPLPTAFCNTCFTRGGGWLNECNEQNQISLIKAYSKLGLEALMTDAGWFTGGWPDGAGNWDPRKDSYPNGMGPVAAAAQENNMIYGLWFEPERVMAGTTVQTQHPDWCLGVGGGSTFLLNFGLPEVQDYFFNIVKGFMDLPGFRVYRQDFNMDPLGFWLANDEPDRQGITEIKYITGLYAYWDHIASAWPDSLREECASGGRRIDLETIMRMHMHQDSDYWFDYDTDQNQTWGMSQYLPNNTFVQHINTLDEYAFHSTMASSLCLGWIADAPGFDAARGKKLLTRYQQVRHLLTGACYPLMPYSTEKTVWMASQYHRPDLGEGMILVFRRAESPYLSIGLALRGLKPEGNYEVTVDSTGQKRRLTGKELMAGYRVDLATKRSSDLIHYKEVQQALADAQWTR